MNNNSTTLRDNLKNTWLIRNAFGWNHNAWAFALKVAKFQLPERPDRVLELGAGRYSMVALIFDGLANEIVISYNDEQEGEQIRKKLSLIRQKYHLKSKYIVQKIDAKNFNDHFDIIIMKSVLGGLFRNHESSIEDVRNFIANKLLRAVTPGGVLISIDNGTSIFEKFLGKLGARKNQWRFFQKTDLNSATKQFEFGLLSSFCFQTRLGILGFLIDNYITYPLDLVLFKIWPHNPTVITSVFNNNDKI